MCFKLYEKMCVNVRYTKLLIVAGAASRVHEQLSIGDARCSFAEGHTGWCPHHVFFFYKVHNALHAISCAWCICYIQFKRSRNRFLICIKAELGRIMQFVFTVEENKENPWFFKGKTLKFLLTLFAPAEQLLRINYWL